VLSEFGFSQKELEIIAKSRAVKDRIGLLEKQLRKIQKKAEKGSRFKNEEIVDFVDKY